MAKTRGISALPRGGKKAEKLKQSKYAKKKMKEQGINLEGADVDEARRFLKGERKARARRAARKRR